MRRVRSAPPPLLALALAVTVAVPALASGAEDTILHIRAQSELRLGELRREVQRKHQLIDVSVSVQLQDRSAAVPLSGEPVLVRAEGPSAVRPQSLVTDSEGRTTATLRGLRPGRYQVSARYAGDTLRDPAEAGLPVDLSRRAVQLGLSAPARAQLLSALVVSASLMDGPTPLPGPLTLYLGDHPIAIPLHDGRGEITLALSGQQEGLRGLHGGGVLTLLASFPGDPFYASAQARREVLITTQAQVILDQPAPPLGEVPQGGRLLLLGSVQDEDGPLEGETVEVQALAAGEGPPEAQPGPGRPVLLGSGVSDGLGRFRIPVGRVRLPTGAAILTARVVPGRSYRLPGSSPPAPLLVLPPEPLPVLYYAVPLLGSVLLLLGALAWRRRGRVVAAWARLRRQLVPPPAAEAEPTPPGRQPGVTLSHKTRVQSLLSRRAPDFDIDGQAGDATFGGPVAAEIAACDAASPEGATEVAHAQADAEGQFALRGLPPGSYHIEVSAPGYLPERFAALVPHRGELRGIRVALLPIRVRILEEWRKVAGPLFPAPERAATWTPRELCTHVRAASLGGGWEPLGELTDLVEEAYYSPRVCTREMLSRASLLAERLGAMLPPPAGPPAPRRPPGSVPVQQAPV